MEILDSKSYCALCNKPLELNNIGAIVKDHTAQNACQIPCVVDYYNPENWPPHTPKEANFVKAEVLPNLEQVTQHLQEPESPTSFNITTHSNNKVTIELHNVRAKLPLEIFCKTIFETHQNITKFAILKLELKNETGFSVTVSLRQNDTDIIYLQYFCSAYSLFDVELPLPIIVTDNDLVIRFETPIVDDIFSFSSQLTIQILE